VLDYEVLSQLSGFGVTIGGPLVAGNTVSVTFAGHYERYDNGGGSYFDPLNHGPGTIPYSFTISRSFSGSSDATMLSLAAGVDAAMAAAGMPQGRAYCDTSTGITLLRLVYNFTVVGVTVGCSITGGASQASIGQADNSFDYHCQYDGSQQRYCWTDAEMKTVIDLFRAGLPRPGYEIWLDVFSTGLYGEAPFDKVNPPLGYNHGYDLWLKRPANAATAAKLDGIHLMSYDVGGGYDPREALQAAIHYLPALPVKLGLRVGPPDYAGIKRSLDEMRDYANHVVVQEADGAMVYALMWDSFDQRADFTPDHPDINLCLWAMGQRFGKPDVSQRAVSRLLLPLDPVVRS
jgi:hypothetical protein